MFDQKEGWISLNAKKQTKCSHCNQIIYVGDAIAYKKGWRKSMHYGCLDAHLAEVRYMNSKPVVAAVPVAAPVVAPVKPVAAVVPVAYQAPVTVVEQPVSEKTPAGYEYFPALNLAENLFMNFLFGALSFPFVGVGLLVNAASKVKPIASVLFSGWIIPILYLGIFSWIIWMFLSPTM